MIYFAKNIMRKIRWNIWKCGNCGETLRLPAEAGSPESWGCSCDSGYHAWYIDDYYTEEVW